MTSEHGRARSPTRCGRAHLVIVLVMAASLATAACAAAPDPPPPPRELTFDGPEQDALIGPDELGELAFRVTASGGGGLDDLEVLLDGTPVAGLERSDTTLVYEPGGLEDGKRVVVVRPAPNPDIADETEAEPLHQWVFTVDTTPPDLTLGPVDGAVVSGEPVRVSGTTEPGVSVKVDGVSAEVAADGTFALELTAPPEDAVVTVAATDPAGNRSQADLELVVVPSRVATDGVRGVHVSFWGWADPAKREPILAMVEDGLIDAIQLDLKDEAGEVGYDTEVALAHEIGAAMGIYDLEAAVEELHALGVPVIGRIVAFADPILVSWAWENDERDWVIQTADGEIYVGRYAGFSNFAHEAVREYNIAVAEEAAQLGVDHILWDYIRRPDGDLEAMEIPGLATSPEAAIVEFARQADERLAPYGVQHGASVYGIAATRPHEIAQDIPGMAPHVDYIAPMVYPSHWGPGEYDVGDPNREPYDIVHRSLRGFLDAVEGTRARVVPWLEDTRYRAWDRPLQVREQLRATADRGIDEWLLWDPWVEYTPEALAPETVEP